MVKIFSFERASICAVVYTYTHTFHPHPTHFLSGSIFTALVRRNPHPLPRLASPVREAHHLRPQSEDQSVVSRFEKKEAAIVYELRRGE